MSGTATTIPRRSSTRQKVRLAVLFLMVIAFPILMNYFSVFLIVEGSSKGIMTFSFFFWTAWTAGSLFFGRAGCGYLCPLGAFQETKDRMVPRNLGALRHLRWVKYVLCGTCVDNCPNRAVKYSWGRPG